MEQTTRWFLPASERFGYQGTDSSFSLFSTSYARQPDEVTHDFGSHMPGVHDQAADSSVQSMTFRIPSLQDDVQLVELGKSKSSLNPKFEASHCQRILFVWQVVFRLCAENHNLALRTWVQLLEGNGGNDIWLWADGDETHIGTSYNLRSHSRPQYSFSPPGWRLTDSDLLMGISAIGRRVEHVKRGITESLHMMKRRERLLALVHPSLRFAAIAWSIATSEAVQRADNSRGIQGRRLHDLFRTLGIVVKFPHPARAFIDSTSGFDSDYWYKSTVAGHKCLLQISFLERETPARWIYIASLATMNYESDPTSYKILCREECAILHLR
jgi:hypothetical protein